MLKFKGRTSQKITIPSKPISKDSKIFALRDSSYIYNWECIRSDLAEEVSIEKR